MVRIERGNTLFSGEGEAASMYLRKHKNRRKMILAMLLLIPAVVILTILCGCSGLMKSTKDKTVNMQSCVYGFKVVMVDPSTGATSPTGEMGFGSLDYHSAPMEKGQPWYARRSVYSLWSNNPSSETEIWVGRASDKSVLSFEAVPGSMIKISGDGVTSGSAKVTITPVTP